MNEETKRLAPKKETLRELFLKSGNICAYPNCNRLMMNEQGTFVGQLCHIEAAETGGERFNAEMTNEQRRSSENLVLMCYEHHQSTNNVTQYPVSRLRQIKIDHETRFSSPDRAILNELTDWTMRDDPIHAMNLRRLNDVLVLNRGVEEIQDDLEELRLYVESLRNIPIEVRHFVGKLAARMNRISNTSAVNETANCYRILVSDVKSAFQLGDLLIKEKVTQLEAYQIGWPDDITTSTGEKPAIAIANLESGWPLWPSLAEFCLKTSIPLTTFTDDLDFSPLDC